MTKLAEEPVKGKVRVEELEMTKSGEVKETMWSKARAGNDEVGGGTGDDKVHGGVLETTKSGEAKETM